MPDQEPDRLDEYLRGLAGLVKKKAPKHDFMSSMRIPLSLKER